MTFKIRFADNLTRCRKHAGLTREELAARAALGRDTVDKYERQMHVPSLDIVVRLGGALSIPPADLLDGIVYRPAFIGTGKGRYEVSDSGSSGSSLRAEAGRAEPPTSP